MTGRSNLRKTIVDTLASTNIDLSKLDKALGDFEDKLRNLEDKLEAVENRLSKLEKHLGVD